MDDIQNILVGREDEQAVLRSAFASNQAEFLAVIGRRRIGKTYLVRETYGQKIKFELTGLQHATVKQQLQNFVFAYRNYFQDEKIVDPPKDWMTAFYLLSNALENQSTAEKTVVFLDELPWLATKRSSFLTALGWFWNSWAVKKNIVLVICGSAAAWMTKKVINHRGGLHNRVTQMVFLQPFSLKETEQFFKAKNIRLNRNQIVDLYMTMGGVPMYLNRVQKGLSAVQNIQSICFHRSGYLRHEFERLFSSLFDNAERYIEVVRTLGQKKMGLTRDEIAKRIGRESNGKLSAILDDLNQSGFIGRYNSFGKKTRNSLYRLIDPYSLFYITYIDSLAANTQLDFDKLASLPNFKVWSGYAFENICLNHIDQIRKQLGISGIYTKVSSFFAQATEKRDGAQIDLVIDRNDKSINLCEIKYSQTAYSLSKKDVEDIERKKQVFSVRTNTNKHLFTTLIAANGAMQNDYLLNHIDQVLTLDDLFS